MRGDVVIAYATSAVLYVAGMGVFCWCGAKVLMGADRRVRRTRPHVRIVPELDGELIDLDSRRAS